MTYEDFQSSAWRSLPPVKKRLAGRVRVNECVRLMILSASSDRLDACQGQADLDDYSRELVEVVRYGCQPDSKGGEYGFIWVFILQSVAAALVQYLIKWWLDRRLNREMLATWQQGLAS